MESLKFSREQSHVSRFDKPTCFNHQHIHPLSASSSTGLIIKPAHNYNYSI